MSDIFDEIKLDAFDLVNTDVFDDVELDPEDKILYSPELKELLQDEINKKIKELPIDKMIRDVVEKQISSQLKAKSYDTTIRKTETRLVEEIGKTKEELKEELVKLSEQLRNKYAEFRNILNSQERYTFGGFAPPNPLNSANNTVLTNTNGTWAGLSWVAGSGGTSPDIYTTTNVTTDRSYDATNTSLDELANVLGSLIVSLQGAGIIH